jgi:DNA modification methylase
MKLYNQDCLEAMKQMEDNQFDLAIVDPPYGIGDFQYKKKKQLDIKKLNGIMKYQQKNIFITYREYQKIK